MPEGCSASSMAKHKEVVNGWIFAEVHTVSQVDVALYDEVLRTDADKEPLAQALKRVV